MRAHVILPLLALVLTAGCSLAVSWTKPGTTDADAFRDFRDCHDRAEFAHLVRHSIVFDVVADATEACMRERGYTLAVR